MSFNELIPLCSGRVLANARPHQLYWGDWECGYCLRVAVF